MLPLNLFSLSLDLKPSLAYGDGCNVSQGIAGARFSLQVRNKLEAHLKHMELVYSAQQAAYEVYASPRSTFSAHVKSLKVAWVHAQTAHVNHIYDSGVSKSSYICS